MGKPHTPDNTYTPDQRRRIVSIARAGVTDAVLGYAPQDPGVRPDEAYLLDPRDCFVTLHDIYEQLRGCIGTFEADSPLWQNVLRMSAAATRDPRFVYTNPVRREELGNLIIEVSVLTPMTPIDDPSTLRVGVDGIYIKAPGRGGGIVSGCYLPQVATDQRWNAEQFVTSCWSHKMGLAGSWRDQPDAKFFVFQSIIIDESNLHA
ncbi:MAG: AmmeMemoRadiSam system protein A [Phycisphaera sp.]|nr:AmmeMemoRadiSam system protein A [Phycisphaera sp.]